jgi:hypothetical protein
MFRGDLAVKTLLVTCVDAIVLGSGSVESLAAAPLINGSAVRIQASSIEGGWHTGTLHLNPQKCWMVNLDRATRDNYTMLALIVADELQLQTSAGWTPRDISQRPAMRYNGGWTKATPPA